MRALIQRVSRASVTVDGQICGSIGCGLLVFLGVAHTDTEAEANYLADKILGLRIFPDAAGKMNLDVSQAHGGVLVVSQFTLYGDCRKGRRPSFDKAGPPGHAKNLYEYFASRIALTGIKAETGVFQAHMDVELVNDGPVTFLLESPLE